ncbi:MAG: Gfo/Idh/MocA family oxidoreductase [Chloroflexota bacterium]|nr:Gfo/Idh/MocA family oxidoreductase [Chloroflexota bacterium]MDE2885300.1 Gfo/Idh/MocA family oxidoreductase [Chloroflexota bacterium]
MEPTLKVGLAGLGSVSRTILYNIQNIENVQLTAVADVRQEPLERARAQFGVETYESVEAMCESSNVDAVWVCTPNLFHTEHTIIAAEHGKHVICEKPMAITLEQAQEMVDVVDRTGIRYVQGHSKIFDPPVRRMREIVSSGEIGRLIQLNNWTYKPWVSGQPRLDTEVDFRIGGGALYRQGPHQTDVVRGIGGGMVKSVRATVGRHNPDFPMAEGNFSAFLEFEDGAVATMAFNGYGYLDITELTWGIGEGGQMRAEGPRQHFTGAVETDVKYDWAMRDDHRERTEERTKQPFYGLTVASCEGGDIRQSPDGLYLYDHDGRKEVPLPPKGHGRGELIEMRNALMEERATFPDARWGMATLEVILAMRESSDTGREVTLSHQVPCLY